MNEKVCTNCNKLQEFIITEQNEEFDIDNGTRKVSLSLKLETCPVCNKYIFDNENNKQLKDCIKLLYQLDEHMLEEAYDEIIGLYRWQIRPKNTIEKKISHITVP